MFFQLITLVLNILYHLQTAKTRGVTVPIMVKAFAGNHTTNGDVNIVRSTVGFAKVNT